MINITIEQACLEVLPVYATWREHRHFKFNEALFLARVLLGFLEATKEANGNITEEIMQAVYERELEYANHDE